MSCSFSGKESLQKHRCTLLDPPYANSHPLLRDVIGWKWGAPPFLTRTPLHRNVHQWGVPPLRTPTPLHRDVHRLEVEKLLDNGRVVHDTLGDHASRGKHCQAPILDL